MSGWVPGPEGARGQQRAPRQCLGPTGGPGHRVVSRVTPRQRPQRQGCLSAELGASVTQRTEIQASLQEREPCVKQVILALGRKRQKRSPNAAARRHGF